MIINTLRKFFQIGERIYSFLPYTLFNGYSFPPLRILIDLTYKCNLHCNICYLEREKKQKKIILKDKELEFEEIKMILDQLTRRVPWITYSGGEIFLRSDIMEILRYTTKRNYCGCITNGTLLSDKICEELVSIGLNSIAISIDGPEPVHDKIRKKGSYKKIIQSIKAIQEYKKTYKSENPIININCVPCASNVHHISNVIDIVNDLNVKRCSFEVLDLSIDRSGLDLMDFPDYNEAYTETSYINFIELERQLKIIQAESQKKGIEITFYPTSQIPKIVDHYRKIFNPKDWVCRVPWYYMNISPYGDVYPCLNYRIGNIREKKIRDLWNNKRYRDFRRTLKDRGVFPVCDGCCYMVLKK